MKSVTLKGNDISNVLHQYHFHICNSGTQKNLEQV